MRQIRWAWAWLPWLWRRYGGSGAAVREVFDRLEGIRAIPPADWTPRRRHHFQEFVAARADGTEVVVSREFMVLWQVPFTCIDRVHLIVGGQAWVVENRRARRLLDAGIRGHWQYLYSRLVLSTAAGTPVLETATAVHA